MKRFLSLILSVCLIVSCAALFSACGDNKGENFPVSVGGVEIKEEPKRVVVLNDAFADMIMYMGYDTKLVGRSIECDQLMLNVLPSVGSADDPAVDTLSSLKPDLVIADDTLSDKTRKKIESDGVTVAVFDRYKTQDDIKQLYIDLGTALGGKNDGSDKGEESYTKLFDLLKDYNTTTKEIVVTDAYLYLDDDGNYCTLTKDSVESKLFGYNGAMNVFASKTSPAFHSTSVTDDQGNVTEADEQYIRYANPTYLFLDGTVDKNGKITSPVYDKLKSDPNLSKLAALKQNRISFIPLKSFYRPGVSFEDLLFTMIDALNKDNEAAEASTAATVAPTVAPAPTKAPATKKVEPTKAPATKAPATEAPPAEENNEGNNENADNGNGGYVEENNNYDSGADNGGYVDDGNNYNADNGYNGDNANYDNGNNNENNGNNQYY